MKPHTYNTIWYSIGVASSLIAITGIEMIQSPRARGPDTLFPYASYWAIYFIISCGLYSLTALPTSRFKKREVRKRAHFYPLGLGMSFGVIFLFGLSEQFFIVYGFIGFIFIHPLIANFLNTAKLNDAEPAGAGQPDNPPVKL